MSARYILPHLRQFDTLGELVKSEGQPGLFLFEEKNAPKSTDDLFSRLLQSKAALVLAEAGYGKSRMLHELATFMRSEGKDDLLLQLGRFRQNETLERLVSLTRKERGQPEDAAITFLILDGIDEIEARAQLEFLIQFRSFRAKHQDATIIASARLFDYRRNPIFNEFKFQHFLLTKFSPARVREYLETITKETGGNPAFSTAEITSILEDFREPTWESIISIPRYLELFTEFHLTQGKARPRRIELYNYFVNKRLAIEEGRLASDDAPLIRRLLEKLALIAEIYQRNTLTFDEAITVLEETDSALANQFLNSGGLQKLVKHSICRATSEDISFEDRTLQEYLASCEIMRLGGQRHLYELVVDPTTKEIHPSWHATLSFCIDHEPILLPKLLDYAHKQPLRTASSQDYHNLILRVNPNDLDLETKRGVFKLIFKSYQDQLIWLDWSMAGRLASFFDLDLEGWLKEQIAPKPKAGLQTPWRVTQANLMTIVAKLLARNRLPGESISFWRELATTYAVDDNPSGVLQRHALDALRKMKDPTVLDATKQALLHPEKLVQEAYIRLCGDVAPDSKQAIDTFIAATKADSIYGPRSIALVKNQEALGALLDALNSDDVFLTRFVENERIFEEEMQTFFSNIDAAWSDTFRDRLITLIIRLTDLYLSRGDLALSIATLLQKHTAEALPLLVQKMNPESAAQIFELTVIFVALLNADNLPAVVEHVRKFRNADWVLYRILSQIRQTRAAGGPELYECGRQLMPEVYAEAERPREQPEERPAREDQIYRTFQFKLEPEKGKDKYYPDVFDFFAKNQEVIRSKATPEELGRLKTLSTFILEKTDTRQARFEVLQWSGNASSKSVGHFSISSAIIVFGHCIPLIPVLDIAISPAIRTNLINAIPYADQDDLEHILALIGDIKTSELSDVIDCYTSKDARYYRPSNLVEVIKRRKLVSSASLLKAFVADKTLESFYRRQALECLATLGLPRDYFESIYTGKMKESPDLADLANGILVGQFFDRAAVRQRIEAIKKRAFPFKEIEGAHTVSDGEHELHQKDFAKPLFNISDDAFIQDFLDLLKWSVDLSRKGTQFESYAFYARDIVLRYFKGLVRLGSYRPIEQLESFTLAIPDFEGKNWLLHQVKELFREYQFMLGAPKRIIDCIRTYNRIKSAEFGEEVSLGAAQAFIHELLTTKLDNWITNEGAKELFYDSENVPIGETRIQKLLRLQICREVEKLSMSVVREPQLLDDDRVDFLISWGFSPNVQFLIEVKKSNHGDLGPNKNLKTTTSHKKLRKYMGGYGVGSGFFLVLNVNKSPTQWRALMANINRHYENIPNLAIVGLDCR